MFLCPFVSESERIADGEMEGVEILEALGIEEIVVDAVVAGDMDGKTPVETDHEEAQVVTQTYTRAEGDILEEARGFEIHLVKPVGREE